MCPLEVVGVCWSTCKFSIGMKIKGGLIYEGFDFSKYCDCKELGSAAACFLADWAACAICWNLRRSHFFWDPYDRLTWRTTILFLWHLLLDCYICWALFILVHGIEGVVYKMYCSLSASGTLHCVQMVLPSFTLPLILLRGLLVDPEVDRWVSLMTP